MEKTRASEKEETRRRRRGEPEGRKRMDAFPGTEVEETCTEDRDIHREWRLQIGEDRQLGGRRHRSSYQAWRKGKRGSFKYFTKSEDEKEP